MGNKIATNHVIGTGQKKIQIENVCVIMDDLH